MTQDQVMEATRKIIAECKDGAWREDQVANILAEYADAEEWKPETQNVFQQHLSKGFKAPFRHDEYDGHIFDRDNNLVAHVRGWGHLSKVMVDSDAVRLQRIIGGAITALLNGKVSTDEQ